MISIHEKNMLAPCEFHHGRRNVDLIETLDARGTKALFFVIGSNEEDSGTWTGTIESLR